MTRWEELWARGVFAFNTANYRDCMFNQKTNGIKRFVAKGVETEDGIVHKFDTVVLATGYDAITGSFTGMGLKDRQGVNLREKWKEGVKTHLGMTAPGLPNMFMVYSPQGMFHSRHTDHIRLD